ncbi:serine--tRNA ligase [Candidatus Saccharibacteria bacterium]|nr:serine--tRNA ligase [Candidatus Saccharibacteria bacterium]
MLDIRFIRENAETVEKKAEQKGYKVDVKHLLELDDKRRSLLSEIEELRAKRNELSQSVSVSPSPSPEDGDQDIMPPSKESIAEGRRIKEKLSKFGAELEPVDRKFWALLKAVPNMPTNDVPVGTSEADNIVAKEWGEKPKFDFEPKTHWEIAEARGLIDKERAAKVTGSRFAYIKGDLVRLQLAIMQFVIDSLTSENTIKKIIQEFGLKGLSSKPFVPVLPPLMIRTEVFDAMDRLEPKNERYKIDSEDLWLQGSAEHTLGPFHMDEVLSADELPMRYLGYATSFRREAGTYGKDTEGIIRMHQFDKLEMESFTLPEEGAREHKLMIAIQEYLMQQLELPYHVLKKCTADIGKPNASGVDLEVWLQGHKRYLETHTADYMTDYQTRRLNIKVKKMDKEPLFVHTNDATAFALGRTMIAIIENYQQADGTVQIPKALQPYMHGQTSF